MSHGDSAGNEAGATHCKHDVGNVPAKVKGLLTPKLRRQEEMRPEGVGPFIGTVEMLHQDRARAAANNAGPGAQKLGREVEIGAARREFWQDEGKVSEEVHQVDRVA